VNPVLLQHVCDRTSGNPVVKVSQSTLYPGVTPAGVLFGHPDNQSTNLLHHTGPTDALLWIRPFGGNEFAVPRKDRVGRHNGGNLP
jgi:hypothetical protein